MIILSSLATTYISIHEIVYFSFQKLNPRNSQEAIKVLVTVVVLRTSMDDGDRLL